MNKKNQSKDELVSQPQTEEQLVEIPMADRVITSGGIKSPKNKKKVIVISAIISGLVLVGAAGLVIHNIVSSEPEETRSNNGSKQDEIGLGQGEGVNENNRSNNSGTSGGSENSNNTASMDPDEAARVLFTRGSEIIRELFAYSNACDHLFTQVGRAIRERPLVERIIDDVRYYKTILSYQETIDKYFGNIFTGEALNNIISDNFANVGGVLYCSQMGGASGFGIANIKVAMIGQSGDRYTYRVTFNHTFGGYDDWPIEYGDMETSQFTIEKVGNDWKISIIDYLAGWGF
jgi:hypothetical protein